MDRDVICANFRITYTSETLKWVMVFRNHGSKLTNYSTYYSNGGISSYTHLHICWPGAQCYESYSKAIFQGLCRGQGQGQTCNFPLTGWPLSLLAHTVEQMNNWTMFFMGGTDFVKLGFQLAHIPLHFLYGGSVRKEKKHLKSTVTMIQYYQLQRHWEAFTVYARW